MTATVAVSPTDLEAFDAHGYFTVEGMFSDAECDEITAHIEAAAFELALGEPTDGPLSYRPMMHLTSPALTAVATGAHWAPIVLPLVGTGDARLYWEQAVAKPPQARTELPWHQDNGYTPLVPEEYLTCWLSLDDAVVDNGCLWVIPGSHKQGTMKHHNGAGPFRVGHDGPDVDGVPVPVSRGSVLVFSSLLMHRSGPNTTDDPRRAWILQYCSEAAASALSGRKLDDRLLCARDGVWFDEPIRERELDLLAVLGSYDQR